MCERGTLGHCVFPTGNSYELRMYFHSDHCTHCTNQAVRRCLETNCTSLCRLSPATLRWFVAMTPSRAAICFKVKVFSFRVVRRITSPFRSVSSPAQSHMSLLLDLFCLWPGKAALALLRSKIQCLPMASWCLLFAASDSLLSLADWQSCIQLAISRSVRHEDIGFTFV